MPIVFEEVTGEIVPERGAPQSDERHEGSTSGEDVAEIVRRETSLMRERERRQRGCGRAAPARGLSGLAHA